jgi:hypothetical protein
MLEREKRERDKEGENEESGSAISRAENSAQGGVHES